MILIAIFVSLCIASLVNFFKIRKKQGLIRNIKGPLTLPLMGSAHKLVLLKPANFLKKSAVYTQKYGELSRLWAFDRLFIPTADYEFVEQLLQHPECLHTGYAMLRPWLDGGLLLSDGEEWQQRRKLLSHAFRGELLPEFVAVFAVHAQQLNKSLAAKCDGKTSFDIYPFVNKAIVDMLIATTLGTEGSTQDDENISDYAKAVMNLITLFGQRFLSTHSANPFIYSVLCPRMKRRQRRLIASINDNNNRAIEAQRAVSSRESDKLAGNLSGDSIYTIEMTETPDKGGACRHHTTLLHVLLEARINGEPLSNAEICAELNTFIFQGSLLTPSALCFTLVMIARHPSVQQRVLEELKSCYADSMEHSLDKLERLQYLECVIKETLRLYPVQPLIGRELKENFPYTHSKVGDGIMPAGAEIYICLYDMLRNPAKFEDPLDFRPERHLSSRANSTLLCYSMGPRSCIAQRFSMLLLKTVIASVMSQYELMPFGEELRLQVELALKSANGFQLGLKAR